MRRNSRATVLALGLSLATAAGSTITAVTTPTALAQGPALQGSHDGAPLGGSSFVNAGDNFFHGDSDLTRYKPGDIINQRSIKYHVAAIPTPVDVFQIKYRSEDANGKPIANYTSVVKPMGPANGRLVSFHSVYDSLDPEHSPSRAIAGNLSLGLANPTSEAALVAHMLTEGYTVAVTDIEGPTADLFVGPTYGKVTLDAIRATMASPETGVQPSARVGFMGYSGGAIASTWAAQMAPQYAPDINDNLVGSAAGGIPVNAMQIFRYVDGAPFWGPITAMGLVGLIRGYNLNLDKYLSDYGKRVLSEIRHASISEVNGWYSGLSLGAMFKPEYRDPRSIPELVEASNKSNLLLAPNPTAPFFIGQADGGTLDGTPVGPQGIGSGDGVMVTGDTQALAHKFCTAGVPTLYRQYAHIGHTIGFIPWYPEAWGWLKERFDGKPAPSDCATIPVGNSAEPNKVLPPAAGGPQEPPRGIAGIRDALHGHLPPLGSASSS